MLKSTKIKIIVLIGFLFFPVAALGISEPNNGQYSCQPIFQVNAVPPNILVIVDNSGSMNTPAYAGEYDYGGNNPYVHTTRYYGYFEPYKKYSYASNTFTRNTSGGWDGNFLNWAVMRRVDLARKVIMGGLCTSRQGGGNTNNLGEQQSPAGWGYRIYTGQIDIWNVTPWPGQYFAFWNYPYIDNGNFPFMHYDPSNPGWVDEGLFTIKVHKDSTLVDEAANFVDGNIAGVLQKVGDKARWGNAIFNEGTGNGESGGRIMSTMGTNLTSLANDLQNVTADTWTPLAEAYYVAVQYFAQEDVASSTADYPNNAVPNANAGQDPYYNGSEFVSCAKSFVILLTDGASTVDTDIPAFLKDFDNDGVDVTTCGEWDYCNYGTGGTDYLDDIALYARTTDLRSSTIGKTELPGEQNVILYTIYTAFGASDPNAENLLKAAAKNGGFVEKDGIFGPSHTSEWDRDTDGVPDTYYKADDGYQLEAKLLQAINDILERAASGTAVSVLATSGEGEGSLVQAFFRPQITSGLTDIKWLGYLQSVWVDSLGNLREDTDKSTTSPNQALDITTDKIISHFVDTSSGDTRIKRYAVSASVPYPDLATASYATVDLDEITAVWQAGQLLAERDLTNKPRTIFTYIDINDDDVVDESGNHLDNLGEVVKFHTDSDDEIKPYLGIKDDATWIELAGTLGNTQANRVTNLINYIWGNEISDLRTRTFDYDDDGTDEIWRLGDIVHSTPVTISKPPDNFHVIYGDESYLDFYNAFKDRETVVYVGTNDGMLHAFTSWYYDSSSLSYTNPYPNDSSGDVTYIYDEVIGDELWGFIPQSLLPHLKWLPADAYSHVYYVDMKPKIFDAKIVDDNTYITDTDTDDDWGTFLLVGFNLGGGFIQSEDDFDYNTGTADTIRNFYPSYALLDVTEPRSPKLMWERSYDDLQASASAPAIVKVGNSWFAVFGSGPSDCTGDSAQEAKVYVVDLKTGAPIPDSSGNDYLFEINEDNAFINSPVSLDKSLNFNVDGIYLGVSYSTNSGAKKGTVYKITIPQADGSGAYDDTSLGNYSDDPTDTTNYWRFSELFISEMPVTASLSLSVDAYENAWVYGGTGRYLDNDDKTDTDDQYFFGFKDPFFNSSSAYYHSYTSTQTLAHSDLLDADGIVVTTAALVFGYSGVTTWNDLLGVARVKDGWIRSMTGGERILTKPTLLGGIVFVPSYLPNADVCGFGGDSYLNGVYFETGTAYYEAVFSDSGTVDYGTTTDGDQVVDKIDLGAGKSSSLGVHVGAEEGAKGFIQQSTGTIVSESLSPAFNIKSGLTSWQETN